MFVVDEATAEAIRRAYDEGGELSGIVEFRRHFPLITDNATAGECVRIIAGWKPLPERPQQPVRPPRVRRRALKLRAPPDRELSSSSSRIASKELCSSSSRVMTVASSVVNTAMLASIRASARSTGSGLGSSLIRTSRLLSAHMG